MPSPQQFVVRGVAWPEPVRGALDLAEPMHAAARIEAEFERHFAQARRTEVEHFLVPFARDFGLRDERAIRSRMNESPDAPPERPAGSGLRRSAQPIQAPTGNRAQRRAEQSDLRRWRRRRGPQP